MLSCSKLANCIKSDFHKHSMICFYRKVFQLSRLRQPSSLYSFAYQMYESTMPSPCFDFDNSAPRLSLLPPSSSPHSSFTFSKIKRQHFRVTFTWRWRHMEPVYIHVTYDVTKLFRPIAACRSWSCSVWHRAKSLVEVSLSQTFLCQGHDILQPVRKQHDHRSDSGYAQV